MRAFDNANSLWQTTHTSGAPHANGPNEVRVELLQGMLDREARVVPAHGFALGLFVLGLFLVAQPGGLLSAIAVRLASLGLTRWATYNLKDRLKRDVSPRRALALLCGALAVSGASWAGLLLALDPVRDPPVALAIVGSCTMTGVVLVIVTYAPITQVKGAFLATFFAMIALGGWADPSPLPQWAIPVLLAMITGAVLFSRGMAKYSLDTAQLMVENRDLTEWLQVSLQEAEYTARHDPLTGLLNRRAFFEGCSAPPGDGVSRHLLMIDLDHFKSINDTFGHETGDVVLKAVAEEMRATGESLPPDCAACVRLGGEEFILVLEGIDEAHAKLTAENLRQRVRRIPEEQGLDPALKVSASIGLARQTPGETLDAVLQRSDLALYRAKDRGRDQVALAA